MPAPLDLSLLCHRVGSCAAVERIAAGAALVDNGALALRFRVTGPAAAIRLPMPQPPVATDGLWQHTCCEAFVAAAGDEKYREFNFSPSGQWAVYDFTAYRERNIAYQSPAAPQIRLLAQPDGFRLDALLPAALLPAGETLQVGLTVVIEALDGGKSYWALAHAADQPDFHLRQSFALTLKRNRP